MDELSSLKKKLNEQEKRIKKLEAEVFDDVSSGVIESSNIFAGSLKTEGKGKKAGPDISFNQVITVLGILGISIGAISFFFYAVANGWIGESLQVGIGVLFGLILFSVAYMLHEKNQVWSNIVFGGAYFLEYLSLGVAVSVYRVIPAEIGIAFGFLILVSSMIFSVKFSSRAIAYFSLVGGFLIPIITDRFESQIFVMIWYLLILIALLVISVSFDWGELRLFMLGLITIFMLVSFGRGESIEFFFLVFYFILFNVSSLVNSALKEKEINGMDSFVLGALPVVFLPIFYNMIGGVSSKLFGLVVILFSFVYLIEAVYMKSRNLSFLNVVYSLIAAGVATLNFGIYFLFNDLFGLEYFIIFFIVEWALFSYLSSKSKDDFYGVVSFLFLTLIALWFFVVLRFNEGVYHATFFMVVLAAVPIISLIYFRSSINYKVNAAIFIISGYLFFYSLFKYLWFFIPSLPFREVILSVLWLIYTLTLFVQVQTSEGKALVGTLLGITLLKIAFKDLFLLPTGYRIIGFILFGILLLIGGYFLSNEKKK
jgi:hypothetical protein